MTFKVKTKKPRRTTLFVVRKRKLKQLSDEDLIKLMQTPTRNLKKSFQNKDFEKELFKEIGRRKFKLKSIMEC